MVNINFKANTEVELILDTPLWAGQGGITKVNADGAIISSGDMSWHPTGSGTAKPTLSLGIVEATIYDGDAAYGYDLALATNPIVGTEIVAVLGIMNMTTPDANAITAAGNVSTSTVIKATPPAAGSDGDKVRFTFLYR